MMSSKSSRARSSSRGRRWSRPGVEGLEGRALLSAIDTAYPLGAPDIRPGQIVVGPDKNLWFTEVESVVTAGATGTVGLIAMIRPTTGAIVAHQLAVHDSAPTGLAFTPDGNIWFADGGNHSIGLFNPVTGYLIEFATPLAGGTPEQVALGPDGNVWFTDDGANAVGMVNPATHAVAEYPLPSPGARPEGIVAGPDGSLWFAESQAHNIASIRPTTRAIAEYPSTLTGGRIANSPLNITAGPDGNLWFIGDTFLALGVEEAVYSFSPSTHAVAEFGNFGNGPSGGRSIAPGPQGDLWSEYGQTVPATGAFNSDPGPPTTAAVTGYGGIVAGPDGNVWSVRTGQVVEAVPVPLTVAYVAGTVARDPISGGGGLAGQTVYLDLNHDGRLDPGDPSVVTDASGQYMFGPYAPTTVTVRVVGYPGDPVFAPIGGGQTVVLAGGRVEPVAFRLATFGSTLPLTFNSIPFGGPNPDVQTAEVNGLYRLILGRAPDVVGGPAAVAALKGGEPVAQLASGLLHSAEYFNGLAVSDYRSYLGRVPAPGEVHTVVSALQGGLGVETLAEGLVSSAEFSALHPADDAFVRAAYGDILGRLPSSAEQAAVVELMAGGLTRASVSESLAGSAEADGLLVGGLYGVFLARAGDPAGVAHWVGLLRAGSDPLAIAADFASSPEFVQRADATVG